MCLRLRNDLHRTYTGLGAASLSGDEVQVLQTDSPCSLILRQVAMRCSSLPGSAATVEALIRDQDLHGLLRIQYSCAYVALLVLCALLTHHTAPCKHASALPPHSASSCTQPPPPCGPQLLVVHQPHAQSGVLHVSVAVKRPNTAAL